MPPVSVSTILDFRFIMAARSTVNLVALIPCSSMWSRASTSRWLDSSKALLGMQPTLKQVPPNCGLSSMTAVLSPNWAARMAAT